MEKKVNINFACPIPWDSMKSINDKDRFCSKCSKKVRDFSKDRNTATEGIECGRFRMDQVKNINHSYNFNPRKVFVVSLLSLIGISAPITMQAQVDSNQTTSVAHQVYQKKSFKISGTVKDSLTGDAIPFANVVVKDQSGNIIAGSSTDFEGQFSIDPISIKLRDQDFSLEIFITGYHDKVLSSPTLDSSKLDVVIEIALQPATTDLPEVDIIWVTGLIDPSRSNSTELKKNPFKK